jgi:peptidoglycan hydrolase CwlO-like protein
MRLDRLSPRRLGVLAAVVAVLLTAGAVAVPAAGAADAGTLRDQIQRQGDQEQQLSSAAARLGKLEATAQRSVDAMQSRLDAKQADLDAWEAKLSATRARLKTQKARLARLQRKLARDRAILGRMLSARYMADKPDLVDVVLNSHGFADLVERMSFLHRVQNRNADILSAVKSARGDAHRQSLTLGKLVPRQAAATAAVQKERDALGAMNAALQARRTALADAKQARLDALSTTRANRSKAQHTLNKLEAEQAKARAAAQASSGGSTPTGGNLSPQGPGGPWAIPWAIVQCESGGQNLPPNSATASGYYQFIDSTWEAMGGSTHSAYQASKAEQDRLAAKLWNGGAGASNWDCASIVGII